MKSSSRLLLGFSIGICVLIIATIVLVLTTGSQSTTLLPEDTPEGTIQRFLLAVQDNDFEKAYSYISTTPLNDEKISPAEMWRRSISGYTSNSVWKATIGKATTKGDQSTVKVNIEVFRPGGPFQDPVRSNNISFFLKKEGPSWLITSPIDIWWIY